MSCRRSLNHRLLVVGEGGVRQKISSLLCVGLNYRKRIGKSNRRSRAFSVLLLQLPFCCVKRSLKRPQCAAPDASSPGHHYHHHQNGTDYLNLVQLVDAIYLVLACLMSPSSAVGAGGGRFSGPNPVTPFCRQLKRII